MSFIAVAILGSAGIGAGASLYASSQQQQGANRAIDAQQQMFARGAGEVQPFIDAGKSGIPTLLSLLTPGPGQTDTLSQLPGFKFLQDWGQKGVAAQATTRGFGGNRIAAGNQFATGTAQQSFGSFAEMLQRLVSMGSGAAGSLMGGANQAGAGIAGSQISGGNAAAAGILGAGGAAQGGMNSLSNMMLLKQLTSGAGGGGMYTAGDPAPRAAGIPGMDF